VLFVKLVVVKLVGSGILVGGVGSVGPRS